MPLLPDLSIAALYAVVVFLLALGFLVVFVETIRLPRMLAFLLGDAAVALALIWLNELGVALLVLAPGLAVVANQVFEWLTTR